MVVNNWFVVAEANIAEAGESDNDYIYLFFIFFYVLSVLICLNIIIAVILDMYGSVERLDSKKGKTYEVFKD